jgi:eukaryotic-like serine/threonine-protein kinase
MAMVTRPYGLVGAKRLVELAAGGGIVMADEGVSSFTYGAGELIAGKYRLVRKLGRGGMGVVWEAHSDALDINVAIKLIHHETNSEERKRLMIEARAAARLADPAIVRVFDCGETPSGVPYVVMELLEGEELAHRLDQRGRIPPIETIRCLLPVVRALGIAHAAGIVHRDVKPENVFFSRSVTGEEQPKLLDFGIAKVDAWDGKRLTQAGTALGSPNYMSPEQARGNEVDFRTDIWSICVVIYETITGQLPFDGDGYNAVMYAILTEPLPSFPEVGIEEPELWEIVERGLQRERSARWQSCEELIRALAEWLVARGATHDVTGMSLQASRVQWRATQILTLASVSPASSPMAAPSEPSTRVSPSEIMTTPKRARPNWYVPNRPGLIVAVLAAIGLLIVSVLFLRVRRIEGLAPSNAPAIVGEPSGAVPSISRQPQRKPEPLASQEPKPVSSADESDASVSAAVSVPHRAPPKKPRAASQGEEFKSPFE